MSSAVGELQNLSTVEGWGIEKLQRGFSNMSEDS